MATTCLKRKNFKILILCIICIFSFTGCSEKKAEAYQKYVQNLLDVNYKGIYTNYIDDNGGNETDAISMHQDCLANLSSQLISHYNLNTNQSVEINESFITIAETIYQSASYEVSESYKENGSYYVDVTVYPMDILNQSYDDILAYIDEFNEDVNNGVYNDYTKEEYDKKFASGIADILSENAESPEYQDAVIIKALIEDDGEYYSIQAESLAEIDSAIIAVENGNDSDTDNTEE